MKTSWERCESESKSSSIIWSLFLRDPGFSLSGGSQLHHQHQGQELPFVAASTLQSAVEPPLPQRRSKRSEPGKHLSLTKRTSCWFLEYCECFWGGAQNIWRPWKVSLSDIKCFSCGHGVSRSLYENVCYHCNDPEQRQIGSAWGEIKTQKNIPFY